MANLKFPMTKSPQLKLKYEFNFKDLLTAEGLQQLDEFFLNYLYCLDGFLYQQLVDYRQQKITHPEKISDLIIKVAPLLEQFIVEIYSIESDFNRLSQQTQSHHPIFQFKKSYVLRFAKRSLNKAAEIENFFHLNQWLTLKLIEFLNDKDKPLTPVLSHNLESEDHNCDRELAIAHYGLHLLENEIEHKTDIERLTHWCIAAMTEEAGQCVVAGWEMFNLPKRLDFTNLVEVVPVTDDPYGRLESPKFRQRQGFDLTDPRMSERQVMNEIHYCVYCHDNSGDFCSKGFPVKKGYPELGLKINPVGEELTGCPLEEKISEMHVLKKAGHDIAALATIMIDNPMCPATGHRICNDCMKACIYQKQQPVNIPQTETRILTDVLNLPWGVEIYDLLTRWNPLRSAQWLLKPYNGLKVLIMGMGPAGFTLAHHLLMEGFAVVGADGLKIEPAPMVWREEPIYSWQDLQEKLSERVMTGFGGVAEYGITVRWDKNFLKLIYLNLIRHHYFQVFGSIRFGGTITVEDAWDLGFNHLALAVGAGLPKEMAIPNSLAPGMRQANDFLMTLQLSGAAKKSSLANLQVRLPAVVIGGGLTGVDTATEVQAYYILQVEKIAKRYQILKAELGESHLRNYFDELSLIILDEFLQHAREVTKERVLAAEESREPNFIRLLRKWGGVTIAYRNAMTDSPAYRRNPEELTKALEEGVYYAEGLNPTQVLLDEFSQAKGLMCYWRIYDEEGNWQETDEKQMLPARSIFVATGARLNVAYEFEHRGTFIRKHAFEYQRYEIIDKQLQAIEEYGHVKSPHFGPFTSYQKNKRHVSFLGDTHPIFHGSVVKAIASAKRIYPSICALLSEQFSRGDIQEYELFRQKLNSLFKAEVVSLNLLGKSIVELVVDSPIAAAKYEAGQFYRLQNYERKAPMIAGTQLQLEALALLAIRNIDNPNYLNFIALNKGVSSRLLAKLKPGEPIALMGPTGARNNFLNEAQGMLIIGGAMAAIYVLSILSANPNSNLKIFFLACMPEKEIFYRAELEEKTTLIWVNEKNEENGENEKEVPAWINTLKQYNQEQGEKTFLMVDEIILVGATSLLQEFRFAYQHNLKHIFSPNVKIWGSVYGPMQCMLKGVCAQCLQWQIDPETGQRSKAVYACSWQQQPLQKIDIDHIDQRLQQNRCLETLSNLWLDHIEGQ